MASGSVTATGSGKQFKCKMVLLGEMAVGKSSLVMRFARGQFRDYHEPTIGAAFVTQTVQLADGASVKFEIWDTAGQERYHALAPMYYRGAHAALVVYDVTNAESFDRAKSWVAELQKQASADVVVALTGNKVDLASTSRAVNPEEAQSYAEQNGLLFMETSARTGLNVAELFLAVAQRLRMALALTADQHQHRSGSGGVSLTTGADNNSSKPSCCAGSSPSVANEIR